jgi:hypothetical protein
VCAPSAAVGHGFPPPTLCGVDWQAGQVGGLGGWLIRRELILVVPVPGGEPGEWCQQVFAAGSEGAVNLRTLVGRPVGVADDREAGGGQPAEGGTERAVIQRGVNRGQEVAAAAAAGDGKFADDRQDPGTDEQADQSVQVRGRGAPAVRLGRVMASDTGPPTARGQNSPAEQGRTNCPPAASATHEADGMGRAVGVLAPCPIWVTTARPPELKDARTGAVTTDHVVWPVAGDPPRGLGFGHAVLPVWSGCLGLLRSGWPCDAVPAAALKAGTRVAATSKGRGAYWHDQGSGIATNHITVQWLCPGSHAELGTHREYLQVATFY